VEWWISFAVAICALFSVGFAVQWLAPGRSVNRAAAFGSGIVFVLVTIAAGWLLGRFAVRGARSVALLWVFVGPAILGVTAARVLGRPTP
jgi:hypothetical protein